MDKINQFIEKLDNADISNFNVSLLFDWDYLTSRFPSKNFQYAEWVLFFAIGSLILLFVMGFFLVPRLNYEKPVKNFISKILKWWGTNAVLLLLYVFFRKEGIMFLNMRLWGALIALSYVFLLVYSVIDGILFLPKRVKIFRENELKSKYLPRKSKGRKKR